MTYDEQDTDNNEWKCDNEDGADARTNRMIALKVQVVNEWRGCNSDDSEDYPADKLPLPGNDQQGY